MIVFDVDGTLIGGEATDWASFDGAVAAAVGVRLNDAFFADLHEVTAQSIIHKALGDTPEEQRPGLMATICQGYLSRLQAAHAKDPLTFPAAVGAVALLQEIKARGLPVAIATGDFRQTILFKLGAAGIPIEGLPLVTASDHFSRADIIAEAVRRTGRPLAEALYVGDGVWDLRACRQLGIPFIGVGARLQRLWDAGATHTLSNLEPGAFWKLRETL